MLLFFGCGVEQSQKARICWETDFPTFLKVIQEATQKNRVANTREVDVDALNKIFLDKTVTWEGTLRYVHKGKPYFVESLVRVDEETKLAAVMYYPDPAQVPEWENIEKGSKVKYSGVIKTVHIDTVVSKDPFAFVDLKGVKPTKVIE